jgi:hypothetical protein
MMFIYDLFFNFQYLIFNVPQNRWNSERRMEFTPIIPSHDIGRQSQITEITEIIFQQPIARPLVACEASITNRSALPLA